MAERRNSTSPLWVSKALPVGSYIHGVCCFQIQRGVWAVPSSITTAPSLRQSKVSWGCQQPSHQPSASNWYLRNGNFSQYLQADCWQGPGTSWRWLETWEMRKGTRGTKGALYVQSFHCSGTGVERRQKPQGNSCYFLYSSKEKQCPHIVTCVLILIQCNWLRHY